MGKKEIKVTDPPCTQATSNLIKERVKERAKQMPAKAILLEEKGVLFFLPTIIEEATRKTINIPLKRYKKVELKPLSGEV